VRKLAFVSARFQGVEAIRDELQAQGIHQLTDWAGCKHGDKHYLIPRNIELVVVLVD
jgi:hypothetical protein